MPWGEDEKMKEYPLLLKSEMVRAILEGRKTQTRCPIVPQPILIDSRTWEWPYPSTFDEEKNKWILSKASWGKNIDPANCMINFCPWQVGDRLWVRETWRVDRLNESIKSNNLESGQWVQYKSDNDIWATYPGRWRPSIHMPRWASRITLEITNIRVERIQEISEEDVIAEGFNSTTWNGELTIFRPPANGFDDIPATQYFMDFWDSIYAPKGYGWKDNPWVWVREFRRINETPTI